MILTQLPFRDVFADTSLGIAVQGAILNGNGIFNLVTELHGVWCVTWYRVFFLDALASLELVVRVTEDFFREIFDQSVNRTF